MADGILAGVRVLDLTTGIAGPLTTMLLADHGADVVRVEGPRVAAGPGHVVWNRGKRRVALDADVADDRRQLLELAARADVLVEDLRPGESTRRGIDVAATLARNPRLVHTSITAYGRDTAAAQRPDIEWLVTARAGLQWDQRGWYGTRMDRIMGTDLATPGFAVPEGVEQTGCREGPIFLAVPWASLGNALLTVSAISAALLVVERTGIGQHVETSLVQAAICMNAMGWQRVERMHPSYRLWYFDRRAPKGIFRAGDGGWLHQWAPIVHEFLRTNAAGARPAEVTGDGQRPSVGSGGDYEALVRAQAEANVVTAAAVATRPRDEWVRICADAGVAAQPILAPEEALLDAPLAREGVIVELDDPEHGPIRQVGHVYGFDAVANPTIRPRAATTTAPDAAIAAWPERPVAEGGGPMPAAPLTGVLVLDLGLAIAGPFGPQVLADLGATVIKVTTRDFDLTDAIYVGSSHGKLALALDLKHERGREIAHRLIARADVVHHNMRTGVAERLGIGYEQARAINPRIVYCHTRGFERDGPRTHLPGNDQMGHALAGTAYEAGGTHHGTPPIWQMLAMGDTGNGMISAAAVIQALRHRDRTGEGQFVHTSILNICMLFNSSTYARPDGSGPERPRIDAGQFGFSALQRLYATSEGWLCLFVRDDAEWDALCGALDAVDLATDSRFADPAGRRDHDADLAAGLGAILALKDADHWCAVLDAAGVPCEVASSTFARELFDDADMHRRGWVARTTHAHLGSVDHVAMPFSFSASAAMNLAGSPVTGQHSRRILGELGYSTGEIDDLVAAGVVAEQTMPAGTGVTVDVGLSVYDITGPELVALARAAEEAGFSTLWLGEHIVAPVGYAAEHPTTGSATNTSHLRRIVDPATRLLDPLVALGAAAAVTERIRLATGIYLVALRHPLAVARMALTVQDIAGGRFMLGVGSGWLEEEFAALGVPYAERISRYEESLDVLRAAWAGGELEHHGPHVDFGAVVVTAQPAHVPLVLGGNTEPALRRAVRLADGWFSSGNPTFDEAVRLRTRLDELCRQEERAAPLPVYVRMAGDDRAHLARYAEHGFDHVTVWANQLWPATGDLATKQARFADAAAALIKEVS